MYVLIVGSSSAMRIVRVFMEAPLPNKTYSLAEDQTIGYRRKDGQRWTGTDTLINDSCSTVPPFQDAGHQSQTADASAASRIGQNSHETHGGKRPEAAAL